LYSCQHGADENEKEEVLSEFRLVLETILQVVGAFSHLANTQAAQPTARFWRALAHKTHDMMDTVGAL